jgi:hypothetical protein
MTTSGTYGTIASTFQHLIAAEQRYLGRLNGTTPEFNEGDAFPGIARLMELAEGGGDQLIEVAGRIPADRVVEAKRREAKETVRLELGVVIVQALHHGNDHRTHICTILGSHDISYGDMDVWAYGEATGALVVLDSNG